MSTYSPNKRTVFIQTDLHLGLNTHYVYQEVLRLLPSRSRLKKKLRINKHIDFYQYTINVPDFDWITLCERVEGRANIHVTEGNYTACNNFPLSLSSAGMIPFLQDNLDAQQFGFIRYNELDASMVGIPPKTKYGAISLYTEYAFAMAKIGSSAWLRGEEDQYKFELLNKRWNRN